MEESPSPAPGVIRSTRECLGTATAAPSTSPDAAPPTPSDTDDDVLNAGRDNPREIRNKAEKQRRDKLNQSISELARLVPPVVAASRKVDKTGVLRLTAHYLRSHQYVFGDALAQPAQGITARTALDFLRFLNGFLITVTYKGLIVVVSQNVQQYLGYSELDLLGQSLLNIAHEDDRRMLCEQLMPRGGFLGPNGELLVPESPAEQQKVADALAKEKRNFVIRLKKYTQRSEPPQYLTCHVQGSLRKADKVRHGNSRCCQMVRRARARGDNPCSSGNDVVFIGVVRPTTDTFMSESEIESFRMEYRTRHSIDGEIIQCEQKVSLITGYMTHEVKGVNAMNFMHRDDVRWVITALREMYDERRIFGESCYRLLAKNGQVIFLKTRGRLEIEQGTRDVTSFVCTNTVVDEDEGTYLINQMKKKFTVLANNNEDLLNEQPTTYNDNQMPIEDPRHLEKVILHMVTNLPSPNTDDESPRSSSPDDACSSSQKLTIIPPKKERIISAIEKIYDIIKPLEKSPSPRIYETSAENSLALPTLPLHSNFTDTVKINLPHGAVFHVPKAYSGVETHSLAPFKESFAKRGRICSNDDQLFVSKISDHVLAAVQLNEGDNAANEASCCQTAATKRPRDRDDIALMFKKKTCETGQKLCPRLPSEGLFEDLLEDNGIDTQLDNALSMLDSIGNANNDDNPEFPDVLLESEFQDLFGAMVGDQIEEANLDAEPSTM